MEIFRETWEEFVEKTSMGKSVKYIAILFNGYGHSWYSIEFSIILLIHLHVEEKSKRLSGGLNEKRILAMDSLPKHFVFGV